MQVPVLLMQVGLGHSVISSLKSANYLIKSEIRELFAFSFSFGDWPRRALSLAISPSLGPSPSVYARSSKSDCKLHQGEWQDGALLLEHA